METFISSLLYAQMYEYSSICHILEGLQISNLLLLLHQLMDFNETFRDIFLTQCGGAPIFIFQIDFWAFSYIA